MRVFGEDSWLLVYGLPGSLVMAEEGWYSGGEGVVAWRCVEDMECGAVLLD